MKQRLISLLVFLLISGSVVAQTPPGRKIRVTVDERVELVTTMQLLFGYPLVGKADIHYRQDVLDYFGGHKGDTSVKYFLNIAQRYFSFIKPINYTLHYSYPGFKQIGGFSAYENKNYGFEQHRDSLLLFIKVLKAFAKQSKFDNFYKIHHDFYGVLITTVQKKVDSVGLVSILEKHYGQTQHSYTLVLSPLFIEAGMSTWIETSKGKDLYSIIGPNLDSKANPDFDTRWLIQYLVMHEFSHPFCNPLIDEYYPALEKDSCLFTPALRKAMKSQGNANWKTTLYELLTRANEITLDRQVFGDADAEAVYKDYQSKHYTYLDGLVTIISEYTAHRDQYPALEAIMPKVVSYFDNLAKNHQ